MSHVYGNDDLTTAEHHDDGGKKSLASRMKEKAKMPGLKGKVKNLKSKVLSGKKSDSGGDHEEDTSDDYEDEHSPTPVLTPTSGMMSNVQTAYSSSSPRSTTPTNKTFTSTPYTVVSTSDNAPSQYETYGKPSTGVLEGASALHTSTPASGTSTQQYPSSVYNSVPAQSYSTPSVTELHSETPSGVDKFNNLSVRDAASTGEDGAALEYLGDGQSGTTAPPLTTRIANTVTGVKDTALSKLGYGTSPTSQTTNTSLTPGSNDTVLSKSGYGTIPTSQTTNTSLSPGSSQGLTSKAAGGLTAVKDTIVGSATVAAGVVGSRMGYYKEDGEYDVPSSGYKSANAPLTGYSDHTGHSTGYGNRDVTYTGNTNPMSPQTRKTYTQQAAETLTGVKNTVASTLGLDKPTDPTSPSVVHKTKAYVATATDVTKNYAQSASETAKIYTATATDQAAKAKDRVAAQTAPTRHDKALSEQVTQTLSSLPATIKETVFGPQSPSTAGGVNDSASSPKSPSVVNRMSGAVSSLFGANPGGVSHDQHTFPAHTDYVKHAPSAVDPLANQRFEEETMPNTVKPAFNPVTY